MPVEPTGYMALLDYFRATAPVEAVESKGLDGLWLHNYCAAAAARAADGVVVNARPWGVRGFYGQSFGPASWGRSADSWLVQASGIAAHDIAGRGLPWASVARLDAQVTIWFSQDNPLRAHEARSASKAAREACRGFKWRIRLIEGEEDGSTLYLGTRGGSGRFLRLYDKWRESGNELYRNAWRYEAELTDAFADIAYDLLLRAEFSPVLVARIVTSEFDRRGVQVPIPDKLRPLDLTVREPEADWIARRIAWLQTQVKPAVDKLLAEGVQLEYLRNLLLSDGTGPPPDTKA